MQRVRPRTGVVLDRALDALAALRLSIRLDDAVVSVRRLASRASVLRWFGPETVLVCHPPTRSRVLSKFPEFPERQTLVEELPGDDQGIGKLLRRIEVALDDPKDSG